jgi:hypothetical protein
MHRKTLKLSQCLWFVQSSPPHLNDNMTHCGVLQDIDTQLNPRIFVTVGVQCIDTHLHSRTVITVGVQCKSIIEHTASPCVMLELTLQTDLEVQDSFCMGDFIQGLYEPVVGMSYDHQPHDNMAGDMVCDVSSQLQHEELYEQYTVCLS